MVLRRRHVGDEDKGSLSIYFISATVAIVPLIGLVVDGAGQVHAAQRAEAVASEAGRSAGQVVEPGDAINGEDVVLDDSAVDSAKAYVTAQGMTPTSTYVHQGQREITVTVETTYDPIFLGAFGLGPWKITRESTTRMHQTDLEGEDYSTESPRGNY